METTSQGRLTTTPTDGQVDLPETIPTGPLVRSLPPPETASPRTLILSVPSFPFLT